MYNPALHSQPLTEHRPTSQMEGALVSALITDHDLPDPFLILDQPPRVFRCPSSEKQHRLPMLPMAHPWEELRSQQRSASSNLISPRNSQ